MPRSTATFWGGRTNELYRKGGAESIAAGLALYDREQTNIAAGQGFAAAGVEGDRNRARLAADYANVGVYVLDLRLVPRVRIGWLETQRDASHALGDRRGEGAALGNLGLAYAALGETRKAIGFYEQALAIDREIGDRRGEGADLGNLGLAYADLGETQKAIGFYKRQLIIVREIGDRRGEGNALANWASLLTFSDPAQARRLLGEALAIYRAIEDPNAANVERRLQELGA